MEMNDRPNERPIIIRRGGPVRQKSHGGGWKLAYADFMTAMMAFFLLMWLLGSVNSASLAGIADYFKQPLKTALMGGSKTSEGTNVIPGGGKDMTRSDGEVHMLQERKAVEGRLTPNTSPTSPARAAPFVRPSDDDADEDAKLRSLQSHIEDALSLNAALKPYRSQIMLDVTRYGLRIQIVDTQHRPMFATASARVEPYMRDILREVGASLNDVPNQIVLEGHTDAQPYAGGEKGYSNWELSADRANASRRELVAGGMADSKVLRVVGLAATNPFNPTDTMDPRNRRISITVLNRRTEKQLQEDRASAATLSNAVGRAAGAGQAGAVDAGTAAVAQSLSGAETAAGVK